MYLEIVNTYTENTVMSQQRILWQKPCNLLNCSKKFVIHSS